MQIGVLNMLKTINKHRDTLTLLVIAVVLFGFFTLTTTTFSKFNNIMIVFQKCVELGLLAIGMTVCIIIGGINLSSAALCSLCTVVIAFLSVKMGLPEWVALIVAFVVAIVGGLINGYLIAYLKVAPMLATIGTQSVFTGVGLVLTKGGAISGLSKSYQMLGNAKLGGFFPAQLFVLIAAALVMAFFCKYTRSGRRLFLVGTSPTVANYSGLDSRKTIVIGYLISAVMSFLAAVVISSRLGSGRPDVADAFLMQSIAAAVFGGASIDGGKGSIGNCMLSVFCFSILSNGLIQLLPSNASFIEDLMLGLLLLALLSSKLFKFKLGKKKETVL